MSDLKLNEVKKLLTSSEYKLVESSRQPHLGRLTESQLKKKIDLTRKARDKWRDLKTQQRRDQQQKAKSRGINAAARSAEKHKVLSQALADFQKQLDKQEVTGGAAGTKSAARKRPVKKRVSKKNRAAGHRATRAAARAQLEETRAALDAKEPTASPSKKKGAKKEARRKPGTKTGAAKKKAAPKKKPAANPPAKKAKTKRAVKRKPSSKKSSAHDSSSSAKSPQTGLAAKLNLHPRDQQKSKIKAKHARIDRSGLTSRTRGHVSARGRRAQGKRDQRG